MKGLKGAALPPRDLILGGHILLESLGFHPSIPEETPLVPSFCGVRETAPHPEIPLKIHVKGWE